MPLKIHPNTISAPRKYAMLKHRYSHDRYNPNTNILYVIPYHPQNTDLLYNQVMLGLSNV